MDYERRDIVARNVAVAMLAGTWDQAGLMMAARSVLGRRRRVAVVRVVRHVLAVFPRPPPLWRLVDAIIAAPTGERALEWGARGTNALSPSITPPRFAPLEKFAGLDIPRIVTAGDLAAWFHISAAELDWFADRQRHNRFADDPALLHYRWHAVVRAGRAPRLIEAPKPRLKAMQKRILREILDRVPVHEAAFGFVTGRSCLQSASRHAGEDIVIAADIQHFFPSVPLRRVAAIFASLGYPWSVAHILTGLCSVAAPPWIFERLPEGAHMDFEAQRRYAQPHLPQGAPTSPALANLVAWRLDCRLQGLARRFEAAYSRYADDLAFSGGDMLVAGSDRFLRAVAEIVADEGFRLNAMKTRVMRAAGRQRLTGLVVNRHLNIDRASFDALKAQLYNVARNGPTHENRSGHKDFRAQLDGRVAWVEQINPRRGAKLRRLYDAIDWPT